MYLKYLIKELFKRILDKKKGTQHFKILDILW